MNISGIKRKMSKIFNLLIKVASDKKTWLLIFGMVLVYKVKTFPIEMSADEFSQILDSWRKIIKELYNLNNNMLVFETFENKKYICNISVTNPESFNEILLSKGVKFECFSGGKALWENPYYQLNCLTAITGLFLKIWSILLWHTL